MKIISNNRYALYIICRITIISVVLNLRVCYITILLNEIVKKDEK